MKVIQMTSVHPRFDTRIFHKECQTLAAAGHDTTLIVADGFGDESRDGIRIVDVGAPAGRLARVSKVAWRVAAEALARGADVCHLHDPELLPWGLWLKRRGMRVIFDAHEDVPKDMLTKTYLHPVVRRFLMHGTAGLERETCRRLDGVIAATPFIREKFEAMGVRCVDVDNFPIPDELSVKVDWKSKKREVCYVGGINTIRGGGEIVRAMALIKGDLRLNLVGRFQENAAEQRMRSDEGWARVNAFGHLDRGGVREVLSRSVAGLVTLHPIATYRDLLPVKMFEYMSAGIPVIASDFPYWREIVEGCECGICVNPLDPHAIAAAIDKLSADPAMAERMGGNGRRAVVERYNWPREARKLLDFYAGICDGMRWRTDVASDDRAG